MNKKIKKNYGLVFLKVWVFKRDCVEELLQCGSVFEI